MSPNVESIVSDIADGEGYQRLVDILRLANSGVHLTPEREQEINQLFEELDQAVESAGTDFLIASTAQGREKKDGDGNENLVTKVFMDEVQERMPFYFDLLVKKSRGQRVQKTRSLFLV